MSQATPEQLRDLRNRARDFARKSIVVDATARLVEQILIEAHAHLAKPIYTENQKEWVARVLATNLASGPTDKTHRVEIDDWIAKVKAAFDVVENMKSENA